MQNLSSLLIDCVSDHMRAALVRNPDETVRPILVGPPAEALQVVFDALTQSGTEEWVLEAGGSNHQVVVLLVGEKFVGAGVGLSRPCRWDYAVTVRNSRRLVLMLADRRNWDARPESLANTTETIGAASAAALGDDLHRRIFSDIAGRLSITARQTREFLQRVHAEAETLGPALDEKLSWSVADRLLAVPAGDAMAGCVAAGIPPLGGKQFPESYAVLKRLAVYVGSNGLVDAFKQMKETTVGQGAVVTTALDQLQAHLMQRIISPIEFEKAPATHYKVDSSSVPAWYAALTASVLDDILLELGKSKPQDKLILECTNGLPYASPLPGGGPFVVAGEVKLRAVTKNATAASSVTFSRRLSRQTPFALHTASTAPFEVDDPAPPGHQKAIRYIAESVGFRAANVDVVSLESFECGGIAIVRDAEGIGVPSAAGKTKAWTQEIALTRGGATEVRVLVNNTVTRVRMTRDDSSKEHKVPAGSPSVAVTEDIESGDSIEIAALNANGDVVGSWTLVFSVEGASAVAGSVFEALVVQHRTRRACVPQAPDTAIHRLELESYLGRAESWRPVVACFAEGIPSKLIVDWSNEAYLGSTKPQIDPRPVLTPPESLLKAREKVRQHLLAQQRCVSEIRLDGEEVAAIVEEYIHEYTAWLESDRHSASWLDVICVYGAVWNQQAGLHVTTEEPEIMLLSALHPLRLGWHVVAQKELAESLKSPCGVAGLVSPVQCPDATALFLSDGQAEHARAFFSLPCDHPHWSVMINTTYLERGGPTKTMADTLAALGLHVEGVSGGFTSQQTQDSLREVSDLLPARSTVRLSIVGDDTSSTECAEGVLEWSEEGVREGAGVLKIEVYDARESRDPTPEQLADLSERTHERVLWFRVPPSGSTPHLDLTIIDQLGVRAPEAREGKTRSISAPGGLSRVRIREDFQNARVILESRVASVPAIGATLVDAVSRLLQGYEELASLDSARTHFRFTPNQDAVGRRLGLATFLSVTSSQIDPACMVRGAAVHGGYLWDYELPGLVGAAETGLGYYLIARPTLAMERSIENAATLLAGASTDVEALLAEVSRRGIPILKRLAGGGSQSRGEMGMLLATRWLQDSFRAGAATQPRLPVWSGKCIHMILPVDPYAEIFEQLGKDLIGAGASRQRPDLVVAAIRLGEVADEAISVKLTPVEVKFRAGGMSAIEMGNALTQAKTLGTLLELLWGSPASTPLWNTCRSALLAHFLDFGFRIYAADYLHHRTHDDWATAHQSVLRSVLHRTASVSVNVAGKLIAVAGAPVTTIVDIDGDGTLDTVSLSMSDATSIFAGTAPSALAAGGVQALSFSLEGCDLGAVDEPAVTAKKTQIDESPNPVVGNAVIAASPEHGNAEQGASASGVGGETSIGGEPTATGDAKDAVPSTPGDATISGASKSPPAKQRVSPEIRAHVKAAFEGFIGNEPAVARLSNDLLRALIEKPPHLAKNYLFTGLPSTGKTELARRMASALKLPFIKLDGRGVGSRDKLFGLMNGELEAVGSSPQQVGERMGLPVLEYPPLIVFIDEIHLVPRALQEALLTMLEAADRSVVLADQVALVTKATFLFATTRSSDVDAAFVSRCDEVQLREYTEEEVAKIVEWKLPHPGWPRDAYLALARLGRCVPRVALQLAGALETAELVAEEQKSPLAHLQDVRRAREIDSIGLTPMDFEYLGIVERQNGPIGEQNLLALMRTVDKDRVLNEIEPFLVRLSLIKRGPRGRELTSQGKEHLLDRRLRGPS